MTRSIIIRPVEVSDRSQWLELWTGYNAFYGRHGTTSLHPEVTEMTWRRFFDSSEPVHCLVAVENGKLLGLVHYIFHRTTIAIAPTCYLQDLFTHVDARGRGAGRMLIEAVYGQARTAGSSRVYWQTHETNTAAMMLYDKVAEKSGFLVYRKAI